MRKLMVGIIIITLLEISIFILIGNGIGVLNTLLLILFTSVLGIIVAKKQGIQSFQNIRNSFAQGEPPGPAMIDTFLIFLGGILLLVPGFLTDIFGIALVVPFTRKFFKPAIYYWLRKKLKSGHIIVLKK